MFRTKILIVILSILYVAEAFAQNANDRYLAYIEIYFPIAVEQQQAYGIPASITLAQGLLESAAGRSTLASEGNNHFGIKCHKDWEGGKMYRDDDAAGECFRTYNSPLESFIDHSKFLKRKRYASLFELSVEDYAGWARGLKRCGYATDPNYADRLISIIERYSLFKYDTEAGRMEENDALFILEMLKSTHPVRQSRGLHYVIANPGDTYSDIAEEFGMKLKKLLKYNDVKKDTEIRSWQEVYLQEKSDEAPQGIDEATIGEDETIHSVAQRFGMKLSRIKKLNPKADDIPGTTLRLR